MRSSQGEVRGTGVARSPGTGVLERAGKLGQDTGGVGRPCDERRLGAWDHRRHQMPGGSGASGRTFHFGLLASRAVRVSPSSAQAPGLLGTDWAAPDVSAAAHEEGREDGKMLGSGPGSWAGLLGWQAFWGPACGVDCNRPGDVVGPLGLEGLPSPSEEDPDAREGGAKGEALGVAGAPRGLLHMHLQLWSGGRWRERPGWWSLALLGFQGHCWPRARSPRTLRRQDVL